MQGKLSTNKIGANLGRGSSAQQLSARVSGVVHNGSGWEGGVIAKENKDTCAWMDGERKYPLYIHTCFMHTQHMHMCFSTSLVWNWWVESLKSAKRVSITSIKYYCMRVCAYMCVCVGVGLLNQTLGSWLPKPEPMLHWCLFYLDWYKKLKG